MIKYSTYKDLFLSMESDVSAAVGEDVVLDVLDGGVKLSLFDVVLAPLDKGHLLLQSQLVHGPGYL